MKLFEKTIGALLILSIFALTGCEDKGTTTVKEVTTAVTQDDSKAQTEVHQKGEIDTHGEKDGKVATMPHPMPEDTEQAIGSTHSATVLEVIEVPPYNYIKVESNGKTFWAAVPQADVKIGEQVSFKEQMWMQNFTSKTLGRTFDKLLFASGFEIVTKAMQEKADIEVNIPAVETTPTAQKVKEVVKGAVAPAVVATTAAVAQTKKNVCVCKECDCKDNDAKSNCECKECDCKIKEPKVEEKADCDCKNNTKKEITEETEEIKEQSVAPVVAATAVAAVTEKVSEVKEQDSSVKEVKAQTKSQEADKKIYTIEELYVQADDLNNTSISVKGKVVKVSSGIMGKNWIHIQDGSGVKGDADIVFTSTNDSATVGDEVVATGTLNTNINFGYGYVYAVIIQESTFTNTK